jgi:hypothetical protein
MSDTKFTAVQLLHPHWRNQAIAQAEARAREPEPRQWLRDAHASRTAARVEAERLEGTSARARAHLDRVNAHHAGLTAEIEADEARSTEQLLEELASGMAGRSAPSSRMEGERRLALASAEAEKKTAERAIEQLTEQVEATRRRVVASSRAVQEAVAAVMIEAARREAESILADETALNSRRAALDAAGVEITDLQRQMGIRPGEKPWPSVIRDALLAERPAAILPSRFAGAAPEAAQRWSHRQGAAR